MNIDIAIANAQAASTKRIEDAAEAAKEHVRLDASKARDWLMVKVGWMIRSNAQRRRFRKARQK